MREKDKKPGTAEAPKSRANLTVSSSTGPHAELQPALCIAAACALCVQLEPEAGPVQGSRSVFCVSRGHLHGSLSGRLFVQPWGQVFSCAASDLQISGLLV